MRSRLKHRRVVGLAVAASALAVAAPVAVAQPSDTGASNLAAPTSAQPATARVDPRSPDARDAALAAQTSVQPAAARVDPRSPDARDAARAAAGVSPSASVQPAAAAPAAITVTEHSSQTLAIVFSACALAIALLAVGFVAVSRRPRPRWNAP